jgi:energy-coupling factor transporter ATP-binding protein EcfA2
MSVIEFDNVAFTYRTQSSDESALDGITFSIESGSFVGITGPTDAGKSSVVRAIASYIPHFFEGDFSGNVTVDGQDTTETTIGELSDQVGIVFEDPFDQLNGASTTVFEEVAFGLENRGLSKNEIVDRVYDSLETVGLEDQLKRNPQQLSGGQTQRLALASILALDPRLLVLDEPTSQLDPEGTEEVFDIVAEMDSSEYTVVVVSQDLQRLASHLDRLLMLESGEIRYDDEPEDVLVQDDVSQMVSVPTTVQIGTRLRSQGLVDESTPVPLDTDTAVTELKPHIASTGTQHSKSERQRASDGGHVEPADKNTTGTDTDTPLLQLDTVHYRYSESIHALRGISLTLDEGCICIIGQNGAGKSTLVKHLNGLLKPTDGHVFVRGTDTQESRVAELAHDVGLSFQNPDDQLFHNTVETEVQYGPNNLGFSDEEVDESIDSALQRMGLDDIRSKNPYDLGVALRKQVAVASVLAMNTPVVVLDEPTGGQDAPGTELLAEVVRELVSDGTMVVVITHDMSFVRDTADRVIALGEGEVLLDDDPESVFDEAETLAQTDVTPPIVTQIGHRLDLPRTVLSVDDLFEFVE